MGRPDDDYTRAIRSRIAAGRDFIVIDTLGKLRQNGLGLWGNCLDCASLYRMDVPASQRISGAFDIDLDKLIAERGADAKCIRMAPVPCPRCGGVRTECRVRVPAKGAG